tara:strand:- start:454 stop:885 length:432 start_codon:yes stop_codon:yes gene_type:complete
MGRVFFDTRENTHSLTGNYTALGSDSGKTFFINVAAGMTLTLPSIANGVALDGWNCKVIIETNVSSNGFNITEGAGDTDVIVLQTTENDVSGSAAPAGTSTGCTTVALAHGADVIGDSFDIICSGTKMFIKANVNADAAVTAS